MALTKQQKWDMIHDVELRLAKEELAERHIKNVKAIENSDKPLHTRQAFCIATSDRIRDRVDHEARADSVQALVRALGTQLRHVGL